MGTLTFTGELTVVSCWCGIRCAVPDSLYREAKNNGERIYCPLGHTFVYTKTEVDRLKNDLEAEQRRTIVLRSQLTREREATAAERRSAAAYKGHVTRLRNRIANGVCPVDGCRRPFSNVRRHIAGQHSEWVEAHPEVLA